MRQPPSRDEVIQGLCTCHRPVNDALVALLEKIPEEGHVLSHDVSLLGREALIRQEAWDVVTWYARKGELVVKLALPVHREGVCHEFLWAAVVEVHDDWLAVRVDNEPFWECDIHAGDEVKVRLTGELQFAGIPVVELIE